MAVEADELLANIRAAVEVDRRVKISEARQNGPQVDADETTQLIEPSPKNDRSTDAKAKLLSLGDTVSIRKQHAKQHDLECISVQRAGLTCSEGWQDLTIRRHIHWR